MLNFRMFIENYKIRCSMSYNEKKYLEDHKKTWQGFVSWSIKGCIIIAIILILMSIFLTG